MSRRPSAIVVGAGIVGASIAYHLARRGAAVTLVEQNCPAGGVSGKSFAWINLTHGVASANAPLRDGAIGEYRRLQQELGGALAIDWPGALTWSDDPQASETMVRDHAARGHDIRLVGRAEIVALEPNLVVPPECAAFAADEGALDPIAATDALVRAAREHGAILRLSSPVAALTVEGDRVTGIATVSDRLTADCVVLAAGTGAARLCASVDVALPVDMSPALLLRFAAPAGLLTRIVSSPQFEARQPSGGGMLAAEDYIDDSDANGPRAVAARTLDAIRSGLRGGESVSLEEVTAGLRPMPCDGLPVIGAVAHRPGLYIAVMHAGIVLAPIVGRLAASEILDGMREQQLDHCRLERFAP